MSKDYHRLFFFAKICIILTLGAAWGLAILWKISQAHSFTSGSIFEINAHGHAQIYGWIGLFIMGFSLKYMPQHWNIPLLAPRLSVLILILMFSGILLESLSLILHKESWAPSTALLGNAFEVIAILLFTLQMTATFRRSSNPLSSMSGFFFASLFFFVAMSFMETWLTWNIMNAPTQASELWYVQTWQPPLRNLQIHGLALFLLLGVLLEFTTASEARKWNVLWILAAGVIGEVGLYLTYRFTGNHLYAAGLILPWILLLIGALLAIHPLKLWRPSPVSAGLFIKAAYGWLILSLCMLLFSPLYHSLSGTAFSHAWYGATRHAIAVGFISLMIMNLTVPSYLCLGPFFLVNLGCLLRVSLQILTDWSPIFYPLIGLSGLFEMLGLAWWAFLLVNKSMKSKSFCQAL